MKKQNSQRITHGTAKRSAGRRPPSVPGIVAALQPFVDRGALAGAVTLVADRERVLSLETVGFADIAAGKAMRPDTLFWIASQTKPITAAAFMMLVDEGKVRMDDYVEQYLPEFKGQWLAVEQDAEHVLLRKPRHPITIRNILSHTSGLPFQSPMEVPTLDLLSMREAAMSYAMTPLQFEPDTRYQYSNAGINTAGRIIEVLSGMSYEEFLNQRLLGPLGMKDTTFRPDRRQLARLATAYRPTADKAGLEATTISQLRYPLNDPGRQPMPAGGLFSTAADVARFCEMVLNGGVFAGKRLLSPAAVTQMTSRHTDTALAESYGLGWGVGPDSFGHGGALATNMSIDSRRGRITVFLVQHAGFAGDGGNSQAAFIDAVNRLFGP